VNIIGILVMKRLKKVRMEAKQMEREIIRMLSSKTMSNVN